METNQKTRKLRSRETFTNPFNKRYWQLSLKEFASIKTLAFAAIILAIRVVIKQFRIPIAPPMLYLGFDFMINSVGSMVYGPIVALAVGAVSDTLGAILFPVGTYFFPFILVEMMSGFVFALFLYRQKITTWRVVLSRLAVVIVCNFIINPLIMTWFNKVFFLAPYEFITIARVAKNAAMFPLECVILVIWLGALSAATYKLGYTYVKPEKLRIKAKHVVALILAVILSAAAIIGYVFWKWDTDSVTAITKAYGGEEKIEVVVQREEVYGKTWYTGTITTEDGREMTLHYDPKNKIMLEASDEIVEQIAEFANIEDKYVIKASRIKFFFTDEGAAEPLGWSYTFTDEEREKLGLNIITIFFDGNSLDSEILTISEQQ